MVSLPHPMLPDHLADFTDHMKGMAENPLIQLENAFSQIGITMYSDEFCCELLAWMHCFGGSNEATVLNPALHTALQIAASRLNIEGGEIPIAGLVNIWRMKVAELARAVIDGSADGDYRFPEWMIQICDRYKLRRPEPSADFLIGDPGFWMEKMEISNG